MSGIRFGLLEADTTPIFLSTGLQSSSSTAENVDATVIHANPQQPLGFTLSERYPRPELIVKSERTRCGKAILGTKNQWAKVTRINVLFGQAKKAREAASRFHDDCFIAFRQTDNRRKSNSDGRNSWTILNRESKQKADRRAFDGF